MYTFEIKSFLLLLIDQYFSLVMICSYILNGTGQQPTTMLRTKEILEQEHFMILELFIYF